MTRIKHIIAIFLLLAAAMLCGCTHNNGDIGGWFGTWKVESVTINGTPCASYNGNMFFKFQTHIIKIMLALDHEETESAVGNWQELEGNTLEITFPDDGLVPRFETGLSRNNALVIEQRSSKHVTLAYVNPATGDTYRYFLKKWP